MHPEVAFWYVVALATLPIWLPTIIILWDRRKSRLAEMEVARQKETIPYWQGRLDSFRTSCVEAETNIERLSRGIVQSEPVRPGNPR